MSINWKCNVHGWAGRAVLLVSYYKPAGRNDMMLKVNTNTGPHHSTNTEVAIVKQNNDAEPGIGDMQPSMLIPLKTETYPSIFHLHENMTSNLCVKQGLMMGPFTLQPKPALSLAQDGAFTSAVWTKLESEVSCHHHSKCTWPAILPDQSSMSMTADTYNGMWAVLSPTQKLRRGWLASVPGQPSGQALSCAQPWNVC